MLTPYKPETLQVPLLDNTDWVISPPTKDEITISELLGQITTLKAQLAAYGDERKHERLDREEDNVALRHENEILSSIVEQLQKDKDHLAEENEVLVNKNKQLQQIAHNFQDVSIAVNNIYKNPNHTLETQLKAVYELFS